jgi:queuine tRNA-ribosyltransferase
MTADFSLRVEGTFGAARAQTVTTPRGSFTTPAFMPVGTRGAVKTLDAEDLDLLEPQVVLGNTYHLMLRPGADVVEALGDLHGFSGWRGHMLTDSGGFQVFSLKPKVDDDGVTFQSTYDGSYHRLTPASCVQIQEQLGADIAMVLDVCAPLPSSRETLELALARTTSWAQRCRDAHTRSTQAQFGIVQGGVDIDLRKRSASEIVGIGFDGYAIGGLSVGETRAEMMPALDAAVSELPTDKLRYLMGVGDPLSLIDGVASGVDIFDCVLPTRLGRHGTVLSSAGRYQVKTKANELDNRPLDDNCSCPVCARYSRGYVRHLLAVGETTGQRLVSRHNVAFTIALVGQLRDALIADTFEQVADQLRRPWVDAPAR